MRKTNRHFQGETEGGSLMSEYDIGNKPCGFCEDGELHGECDALDCSCDCSYGNKPKKRRK